MASEELNAEGTLMDMPNTGFTLAGGLDELKANGRLVVHGAHRPILVVYDRGRVFALDNRCPHMGFPLDRGSVEDGILTCHWHHADSTSKAAAPSICGRTTRHLPGRGAQRRGLGENHIRSCRSRRALA